MIPAPGTVIGHRGAAGLAPGNSLAGVAAAAAHGCTWVELDVRLTADGVAVLHHDHRTSDGLPVAALASASAASRGLVPLSDALAACRAHGVRVNLELKACPVPAESLVAAVMAAVDRTPPPAVVLSSFDPAILMAARVRRPAVPRALLVGAAPAAWGHQLRRLACDALHLERRHAGASAVGAIRSAGVAVGIYTVNDPCDAAEMWARGVGFLFTDRPDRIAAPAASHALGGRPISLCLTDRDGAWRRRGDRRQRGAPRRLRRRRGR